MTQPEIWADTDEIPVAQAVPVTGLAAICAGRRVVVAGHFADLLAAKIAPETTARVYFPGSLSEVVSARDPHLITPDALPRLLTDTDVLVLADANWATLLLERPDVFHQFRRKVRHALIFPARFPRRTAFWRWGDGSSWAESSGEARWMWNDAADGRLCADLWLPESAEADIVLRYDLIKPENSGNRVALQTAAAQFPLEDGRQEHRIPLTDGQVRLVWQADRPPRQMPNENRQISFGISGMTVATRDGEALLCQDDVYLDSLESAIRRKLHDAGFAMVGGLIAHQGRASRTRPMAVTVNGPGLPKSYTASDHVPSFGSLFYGNEVSWVTAFAVPDPHTV